MLCVHGVDRFAPVVCTREIRTGLNQESVFIPPSRFVLHQMALRWDMGDTVAAVTLDEQSLPDEA